MSERRYKSASFGRLAMIFAGIMFLFLTLSASQTAEKLKRDFERHLLKTLETSLDPLIAATSDEAYVFDRFKHMIATARNSGIDSQELAKAVEQSASRYETPVKAFFYSHNQLKKSFNASPEELALFAELPAMMAMNGPSFEEAQRKVHQSLLATFGPGHRLELLKLAKASQKRYKFREDDQFYYWNTFPDGIGVFFIATRFPGFIDRFTRITRDTDLFGAGDPTAQKWVAPAGLSEDQTAAARIKARISGQSHTIANGFLWYFVDDESGSFWCRVTPQNTLEDQRPHWPDNLSVIAGIFAALAFLLYLTACTGIFPGAGLCDWLDSLSIRYRIMGLFAMASVFPVIFTFMIGATSVTDRQEVIENSIIAESIAAIEPLEKMYNTRLAQSEALGNDLRNALLREPASEEMFQRYLRKHSLPRLLARLEVRDGDGRTLFSTDDREVHGVAEAMDIFSRIALKLHAPLRMGAAASKISPAEIVSESVLSTDEIGMATIMRQRGRQWIFQMGTFPTTWYWDVYPETASGPGFMCVTTQMLETYLAQVRDVLGRSRPENGSIQLATELNYHFSNFSIYPHRPGLPEEELMRAAIASFRTNRVVFREMMVNGRPFWATIKPEKNISTHVFIHLVSQQERLKILEPLKWRLLAGGVFALIISLIGAMLITKLIILPVGDLNSGIRAIRERHKDFRIPVRRNDELGTLSAAFNKVIEELKELEYGKIVQDSLLPRSPIVPPGYEIAFFNTSATDLAGDYHDCVQLDDGRVAIILGDVTGHGISAALAMAMAKATVNYAAADGSLFPAGLIDMLNALFYRELKPRNKFMTLVTIVLDPASGRVEIDNAGQSYPRFYCAATDTSSEVELPSMPLGAMKKRRGKIATRQMQSGDAMILYTDGIIECSDLTGDMFGYDRFQNSFEELVRKGTGARETLLQMMHNLDSFRQPGPYPDDVTLVILKKI